MVEKGRKESGAMPSVDCLNGSQIDRLTEAFKDWYDSAPSEYLRRVRGRYRLAFLCLRFTGARLGEILKVDDSRDIDFGHGEIRISISLFSSRQAPRTIPIPGEVLSSIMEYIKEFPKMRGKVLALDQGNFRREFYRRAQEAEIPRELSHPHILRHTRAIEMLRAGVPLTTVQDLLGHLLSSTTVIYLQRPETTAKRILEDKGLL